MAKQLRRLVYEYALTSGVAYAYNECLGGTIAFPVFTRHALVLGVDIVIYSTTLNYASGTLGIQLHFTDQAPSGVSNKSLLTYTRAVKQSLLHLPATMMVSVMNGDFHGMTRQWTGPFIISVPPSSKTAFLTPTLTTGAPYTFLPDSRIWIALTMQIE